MFSIKSTLFIDVTLQKCDFTWLSYLCPTSAWNRVDWSQVRSRLNLSFRLSCCWHKKQTTKLLSLTIALLFCWKTSGAGPLWQRDSPMTVMGQCALKHLEMSITALWLPHLSSPFLSWMTESLYNNNDLKLSACVLVMDSVSLNVVSTPTRSSFTRWPSSRRISHPVSV